jgi:hypothetical protein
MQYKQSATAALVVKLTGLSHFKRVLLTASGPSVPNQVAGPAAAAAEE